MTEHPEWIVRDGPSPITLRQTGVDVIRVEHECNGGGRWGQGVTHVVAPALQISNGGHTFRSDELGNATVTPSILCPDCGLHGFVTDGVWRDC